jgi:hypothetical protein
MISPGKRVTALLLNMMTCEVKAGLKSLAYAYEFIVAAFLVNIYEVAPNPPYQETLKA